MKISKKIQIPFIELSNRKIDLLITASGYEARSTFLSKKFDLKNVADKICFGFKNELSSLNRKTNDFFFQTHGFEIILADSDSDLEILDFLDAKFKTIKRDVNVVVDYSSMSRVWYSAILRYFSTNKVVKFGVNIYCCYSIAKFTNSPRDSSFNLHIGPIRGFSNLTIPQKPTALIIGLGYEKNRATGLNEYFDGETFAFFTDNSRQPEFSEEVKKNNAQLLNQLKPENICTYSIIDLNGLYHSLYSLCKDLESNYRVIIAPCGPKSFALISLIVSLELKNIGVWRISPGKSAMPLDKVPEGEISLFQVSLEPTENLSVRTESGFADPVI